MKTIKKYLIGSKLSKEWLIRQTSNIEHLEIVGESDCVTKAEQEIIQLLPDVVIHVADKYEEKDILLLQKVKAKSPDTYYIVVGNSMEFSIRVRCLSVGADAVLNLQYEMTRINGLLRNLIFTRKSMGLPNRDLLHISNDLMSKPALHRYFSFMNDHPECLMFADRDLVLRHFNHMSMVKFSAIQEFLPDKLERLIGRPLHAFHREQSISTKILSDPRNLPYRTQIIIGPKIFDLNVNSIYDETSENRVGVLAQWIELPEINLEG